MEEKMAYSTIGRGLALASALAVGAAFTAPPAKADWHHHGGISTGAAVGIGLGSFALGTALGSAAAYPYYGGYYGYPYAGYGYTYPAYSYGGYAPYYGGYYGTSYGPYYGYGWGY
jgi:hypothetical protein